MTISGTTLRNDYVSVGQVGPFAYTFRILNSTHLGVYLDGVLQGSGYTVTNVGDVAGGVVNFASATNAGAKVTLLLNVPFTQPTDYVENDPDPAQVKEDALDLACQRDRQLAEVDQRTMKFPTTSTTVNKFLPEPETGKLLRWKSTGDLENVADTTLSTGGATLPLSIANGGTGGTTVATARENLSTQTTIVAAATLPVTAEQYHIVTGNTGITALASKAAGTRVVLRFTGTPLITHNATSLILLGAVNYQVVVNDQLEFISEGAGNWREFDRTRSVAPIVAVPRGYLFGLTLSNNSGDPTNDIDFATGECTSDDALAANRVVITGAALTKQLDAAWAVGTNAGMRDTGAIANGTWHVFAIQRPDTGVNDALASLSPTAPTMPTNYTKKRRIGAIIRVAGVIVGFVQDGDTFQHKDPPLDIGPANNPGTSAVLRTLTVPSGINVLAIINVAAQSSVLTGGLSVYLSDPAVNDEAASDVIAPLVSLRANFGAGTGDHTQGPKTIRTNTSSQIRSRHQSSDANTNFYIATLGWIDRRGRDA